MSDEEEKPLINPLQAKRNRDWSILANQVVGGECWPEDGSIMKGPKQGDDDKMPPVPITTLLQAKDREIAELKKDKERLDFIESKDWFARFMARSHTSYYTDPPIREQIDKIIKRDRKEGGE